MISSRDIALLESVPEGRTKVSGTLKPQFQTPLFGLLEQTLIPETRRCAAEYELTIRTDSPKAILAQSSHQGSLMRPSFPRRPVLLAAAACLLLAGTAAADNPSTANLNKKIANVTFTDAAGKTTTLYDLKDKKAIVLVFLSSDCPVSTSYSQSLAELATEHAKQGVAFLGLTVNQDETPAQVAKFARDYNLPFPLYLDRKFAAADAVKADVTP